MDRGVAIWNPESLSTAKIAATSPPMAQTNVVEMDQVQVTVPPAPKVTVSMQDLETRYGNLGQEELLQLFRHLSLLLTLLSAICHGGHPSFNSQEAVKERSARLMNRRPRRVVDAAVTLLVRNKEVIAGMSYDQEKDEEQAPSSFLALKNNDCDTRAPDYTDAPNLEGEGVPPYETDRGALRVAAIANPSGKNKPNESPAAPAKKEDLGDALSSFPTLCKPGKSYWPTLRNSNVFQLRDTRKLSWEDHAATLCDYLNTYINVNRGAERDAMSIQFFKYLILACHQKMHQRTQHWVTHGQLYEFHRIIRDISVKRRDPYSPSVTDTRLARNLRAMRSSGMVEVLSIIADASLGLNQIKSSSLSSSTKFSKLLFAANEGPSEEKPGYILWNENLYFEFHLLLISVTMAYIYCLKQLAEQYRHNKQDTVNKHVLQIVDLARLLSSLVESDAFLTHLMFLQRVHLLVPPKYEQKELHGTFIKGMTDTLDIFYLAGGEDKSPSVEGQEDKQDDEEPGDIDDSSEEMLEGAVVDSLYPEVVQSRFKLLIGYLGAKRVLENHSYKVGRRIQITLLEMQLSLFAQPSWQKLKCLMQDAVDKHGQKKLDLSCRQDVSGEPNAGRKARVSFFEYIEDIIQFTRDVKLYRRFLSILKNENSDFITHYVSLHCESILAALARLSQEPDKILPDELAQILKSLDPRDVGVSKLCCPSCWEFMNVLRNEFISLSEGYQIPGRHFTLYPVQLPAWLPKHILYQMIYRFEVYVAEAIWNVEQKRIGPPIARHSRGDSLESNPSNYGSESSNDSYTSMTYSVWCSPKTVAA